VDTAAAQAVGEGLAVLAADVVGLRGGRLFLGEGGGVAMPSLFFVTLFIDQRR
jgi:hypothetical protein